MHDARELVHFVFEESVIGFLHAFDIVVVSLALTCLNGSAGFFVPLAVILQNGQIIFAHGCINILLDVPMLLESPLAVSDLLLDNTGVGIIETDKSLLKLPLLLSQDHP